MKTSSKRALALAGSTLMVMGVAAGPANAQDRDNDRRGGCSVELDQRGRGSVLEVSVDASRGADRAVAFVNFDRGQDVRRRVELNRRGEGEIRVQIPRRADSVEVTVVARDGRRVVTCDADLDLDRRNRR